MDRDRINKLNLQNFSTANLFSSRLSQLFDQADILKSPLSQSEINKILRQCESLKNTKETAKISKELYEFPKSIRGILDDSNLRKELLEPQKITENLTGIAKLKEGLFESQNNIRSILNYSNLEKEFKSNLYPTEKLKQLVEYSNQIDTLSSLTKTLKIEGLTENYLSKFAIEDAGKLISLSDNYRKSLLADFDHFSSAYSRLAELRDTKLLDAFPANLFLEYPALEILESTNLIEVITEEDSDRELESERISSRDDVLRNLEGLEKFLIDIGVTELIVMWKGAIDAIESEHSDYARHCSVSLRELLTQVLHRLAPEEEIKKWTDNPQMFDRNRPTRRARLLYICRSVNEDIFTDFIDKDVSSILEFFKLFQRGTHQVQIPFTKRQLQAMKSKVESTLCYLIEIWKLNND